MSSTPEVTVYDRMCWPEAELERALALGAHRRELAAYLGGYEYTTLAALARKAMSRQRAGTRPVATRRQLAPRRRPKVYLLPGILGSQLGRPRGPGEPPDLLWIDPADIVHGRLIELRLRPNRLPPNRLPPNRLPPGRSPAARSTRGPARPPRRPGTPPLQPLGAIVYSYLALKLRLAAAGFEVVLHDYDWRGDVLATGRALADRLAADDAEELALIGHSMGALVARAAIAGYGQRAGADRITRVIGLGAPHGGSMAAVQALRASYPIVGRLAAIDRVHDADSLTRGAFRGFTSLYQLLPVTIAGAIAGDGAGASAGAAARPMPDLFDPRAWPQSGARPDPRLLRAARHFGGQLAPPDARFVSIVGTGQRTVTGVERRGQQFRYQISSAGDGTVACARATLPGVPSYSLRCDHGELPRSPEVAAALVDLLQRGATRRLRAGVFARHGRSSFVTDSALRRELARKIDWYGLSIGERRQYLDRLNAPPASYRAPKKFSAPSKL
jgi:pimeloyl-ACP methyl ester carboxylesterase